MATKITTVIDPKSLGPTVATHLGSQIVSSVPALAGIHAAVQGNAPHVVGPNANPATFYAIRNNRLLGPFPDLYTAKAEISWIAQREAELGIDI